MRAVWKPEVTISVKLEAEIAKAARVGREIEYFELTQAEVDSLSREFGVLIHDPRYASKASTYKDIPIKVLP